MISVILPSYDEQENIARTAARIGEVLTAAEIDYELVFVDDGSADGTWPEIEKAASRDIHVTGVHFSRNFGKEAAIMAGLSCAEGDCCAVMDCDLQHPAEVLPEMFRLWEQGYEIVEGVKRSRGKEGRAHRFGAGLFYRMISKAAGVDLSGASDFKLMDRKVVDVMLEMPERNGFFRALSVWVGYRSTRVEFDVQERTAGKSKWSSRSLIRYAFSNIASFSAAPMQVVTVAGVVTFLIAVILGLQTLYRYFTGNAVEGFTTVILLLLLLGSIIMMSLGIIGYYIAKIYEEVQGRPRYIISKRVSRKTNRVP